MTDTPFEISRRSFLERLAAVSAVAGMEVAAPWSARAAVGSTSERVRLGIIGTGDRGRTLIQNLLQTKNCSIVALCDNFLPHLQQGLALLPRPVPAYADYRAMLDARGLDAVVIATPLHMHKQPAIDALDAGLHVWCEKSMARTIADCGAMVAKAKASRRILQIGHQRLFKPTYLNALARVKAGEIGNVTQIRANWHRNSSWRQPAPPGEAADRRVNWRLYRESSGGLMTELACHQIQVANWFLGAAPQRVLGSGSNCFWKDGREVYDHVALIYEYEGGRKLVYTSLLNNRRYGCEEQIQGNLGTIEPELGQIYMEKQVPVPGLQQLSGDVRDGVNRTIPIGGATWLAELPITTPGAALGSGEYDETMLQFEAFAEAVKAGRPLKGVLQQAYDASVAALLGEQAMDSGKPTLWPRDLPLVEDEGA